jgi:predicted RNA-binding Zn-ribbon protein involved in translation (DUF1610 family)
MKCSACNIEMQPLVAGIFQCPQCKKIMKEEDKVSKVEEQNEIEEGAFQDGEYFHKNVNLNQQYEIAEKGITIFKTPNRWLAVLICHNAYLKSEKYIRLSFWKKSFYQHGGMFKIYDKDVLINTLNVLEKIDESFDDLWTFQGKFRKTVEKSEKQKEKEKKLAIIKFRIIENKTCPKCQKKMDKMKSHYECQHCGEIVILEGYNQPIFNISASDLELDFTGDFPINYYMPVSGITVKRLMGEWKALVVIYSNDNPTKKWLRFYWWSRNLQNIMKYGQREMGEGTQMGWKAQRGAASPNLYDKKHLKPLINAFRNVAGEMNWDIDK